MKKLLILSIVGFAAANMKNTLPVNKALALQETTTTESSVAVTSSEETTTTTVAPTEDTTQVSSDDTVAEEQTTDDTTTTTTEPAATEEDTTTTSDDTTTAATDDTTATTDDSTAATDDQTVTEETVVDEGAEEEEVQEQVVITVNKNKVRDFIRDTQTYLNSEGVQHIADAKRQVIKEAANLYKNTVAKIALNFGKKVSPVLETLGDATEELQVDDECDQSCATNCFKPEVLLNGGLNVFDLDCLADCNCQFKVQKLNDKDSEKAAKEFQKFLKKADKLEKFVEDAF